MNKKEPLLVIFILVIALTSCATNKIVYLKAQEPFTYIENELLFRISEKQEYWIHFDPDKWASGFTMFVDSDIIPEYLKITKLTMVINDLNISVIKDNINLGITLVDEKFETLKQYSGYEDFDNLLYTSDIVNAYNEKNGTDLSSNQMFNKFREVKKVLFLVDIEYEIQGKKYNSTLKFKFKTRNVISNRFWDTIMSV